MFLNKRASFTISSNLVLWVMVVIPFLALSIIAFVYLTSTTADSDLDISNIKHFTLKQAIIDKCLSQDFQFDINKLNEQNINNCIKLDNSFGLSIILEDLNNNAKKDLVKNSNMIKRSVFCNLDKNLRCSDFKNVVLVDGVAYILKIKVVNEYE